MNHPSIRPEDGLFSYGQIDSDDLRGPYCVSCMNENYRQISGYNRIPFFLHFWNFSKCYKIGNLLALNGSTNPFLFDQSDLEDELRLMECANPECVSPKLSSSFVYHVEPITCDSQTHNSEKVCVSSRSSVEGWKNSESNQAKYASVASVNDSYINPPQVTERRPVEWPLLFGTCYKKSMPVRAGVFEQRREQVLTLLRQVKDKEGMKEEFDNKKWIASRCDVCDDVSEGDCYVTHVTSFAHWNRLCSRKRWVTLTDFEVLESALKRWAKKDPPAHAVKREKVVVVAESTPLEVQARPLMKMPLFCTLYPTSEKLSYHAYLEKLANLRHIFDTETDHTKLNARQAAKIEFGRCSLCQNKLSNMSDLIEHITGVQHRNITHNKFHVTVKDINEYMNLVREAKLPDSVLKSSNNGDEAQAGPSHLKKPEISGENPAITLSKDALVVKITPIDAMNRKFPFLEGLSMNSSCEQVLIPGVTIEKIFSPCYKRFSILLDKKAITIKFPQGRCVICKMSSRNHAAIDIARHVMSKAHFARAVKAGLFFPIEDLKIMINLIVSAFPEVQKKHQGQSLSIDQVFKVVNFPTAPSVAVPHFASGKSDVSHVTPPSASLSFPFLRATKSSLTGIINWSEAKDHVMASKRLVFQLMEARLLQLQKYEQEPCTICGTGKMANTQFVSHVFHNKHFEKARERNLSFYSEDILRLQLLISSASSPVQSKSLKGTESGQNPAVPERKDKKTTQIQPAKNNALPKVVHPAVDVKGYSECTGKNVPPQDPTPTAPTAIPSRTLNDSILNRRSENAAVSHSTQLEKTQMVSTAVPQTLANRTSCSFAAFPRPLMFLCASPHYRSTAQRYSPWAECVFCLNRTALDVIVPIIRYLMPTGHFLEPSNDIRQYCDQKCPLCLIPIWCPCDYVRHMLSVSHLIQYSNAYGAVPLIDIVFWIHVVEEATEKEQNNFSIQRIFNSDPTLSTAGELPRMPIYERKNFYLTSFQNAPVLTSQGLSTKRTSIHACTSTSSPTPQKQERCVIS